MNCVRCLGEIGELAQSTTDCGCTYHTGCLIKHVFIEAGYSLTVHCANCSDILTAATYQYPPHSATERPTLETLQARPGFNEDVKRVKQKMKISEDRKKVALETMNQITNDFWETAESHIQFLKEQKKLFQNKLAEDPVCKAYFTARRGASLSIRKFAGKYDLHGYETRNILGKKAYCNIIFSRHRPRSRYSLRIVI